MIKKIFSLPVAMGVSVALFAFVTMWATWEAYHQDFIVRWLVIAQSVLGGAVIYLFATIIELSDKSTKGDCDDCSHD